MTPQVGERAPDFSLPDQDENELSLASLRGRRVVLYFYPKDDTSGCTAEACGIRDVFPDLRSADAVVLGVSPDSPRSHRRFREKYGLPFTLLSDTEHDLADQYGVWVQKRMYGREYMGVARTTFIIGPDGTIEHVFEKVKLETHAQELLAVLRTLGDSPSTESGG